MAFRVLITDHAWPALDIERRILGELGAEIAVAETASEAELTALARDADAILTNWAKVPERALDGAERCLVVARYGVGVDNIPVARATELGILVTNVPDFCTEEVSDHALALLLACARRVVQLTRATRAGSWNLDLARGLPRLRGQRLGLIGFGGIPHALVPKALGFGLDVLAYTPRLEPGRDAATGVETTNDLAYLLGESDYVSLHAPASPETHGLIGEPELRAMKPTAFLINTSRGALVDEAALLRALTEGWIAGAALDVMAAEPPPADDPLLALPNVIVTPHVGFYSEASVAELATRAAQSVAHVLRGELPPHIVNPGVLRLPAYRLARSAAEELEPNVTVGPGTLAGKGVYAARSFEAGELVVPYDLRELTQEEFDDLPPGEWEWTHSFHGRIYLFSEPERFVNHSDDPSTYPDHTRGGNVALRPIQKGEAVTIDNRRELQYELDTFLGAYEDACNNREFTALTPLIADDAVYWLADRTRVGRAAIQDAFEDAWSGSHDRANVLADVAWVAANYWVSACTYTFNAGSVSDGERQTLVLRRLNGGWRVTHLHSSSAV